MSIYKGYLILSMFDGRYMVMKDGIRLYTRKSIEDAKKEIDNILD